MYARHAQQADGGIADSKQVFQLPNLAGPSYITDLRNLPTTLTASGQAKRIGAELAAPVEVLVCDLGDEVEMSMQMIVRERFSVKWTELTLCR